MDFKRILWPTDLSDEAAKALPFVTSLAGKYGAAVIVLNVQEEVTRFERLAKSLNRYDLGNMRDHLLNETHNALDTICKTLGDACPLYEKQVRLGDPADEILKFAESEDIDLIVMATHGYGGLKRFAYGSVAQRVVHDAVVPVLTVRGSDS